MIPDKESLESSITIWGWFEDSATLIVFIGGVGESICDLTKWIKCDELRHKLEKLFAIILLLGLVGELLTQHKFSAYNGELIAVVDAEAAQANKDAATAQEQAEKTRLKTARIEELVAWRSLPAPEPMLIAERIRPFKMSITVHLPSGDPEAAVYGSEIIEALRAGGAHVTWVTDMGGPTIFGVLVPKTKDNSWNDLLVALMTSGVADAVPSDITSVGSDETSLYIGHKKPPNWSIRGEVP